MLEQFILLWSGIEKSERVRIGIAELIWKNLNKNIQDI
jgi:hypothetical protein